MLIITDNYAGLHYAKRFFGPDVHFADYLLCSKVGIFQPSVSSTFKGGHIANQEPCAPDIKKAFACFGGKEVFVDNLIAVKNIKHLSQKAFGELKDKSVLLISAGDDIASYHVAQTFLNLQLPVNPKDIKCSTIRRSRDVSQDLLKQASKIAPLIYTREYFRVRVSPLIGQYFGEQVLDKIGYISPLASFLLCEVSSAQQGVPRALLGRNTLFHFGAYDFKTSSIRSADIMFAASHLVKAGLIRENKGKYYCTNVGERLAEHFNKQMLDRCLYELISNDASYHKIDFAISTFQEELKQGLLKDQTAKERFQLRSVK